MRVKINGKWKKDAKGIKDNESYIVEIPRRKEMLEGIEYERFSQVLKMKGKDLRKLLEMK
jgi:hypothetical protein